MGTFDRFNGFSSNILLTFSCYFDNPQCPGVGHLNGNSQLSSNALPMPGLPPSGLTLIGALGSKTLLIASDESKGGACPPLLISGKKGNHRRRKSQQGKQNKTAPLQLKVWFATDSGLFGTYPLLGNKSSGMVTFIPPAYPKSFRPKWGHGTTVSLNGTLVSFNNAAVSQIALGLA